jgi:hypothetical protein
MTYKKKETHKKKNPIRDLMSETEGDIGEDPNATKVSDAVKSTFITLRLNGLKDVIRQGADNSKSG